MAKIKDIIANAIKEADTSYFSEDYAKQSTNVIKALRQAGYTVIPNEPSEDMIALGKEAIAFGASKPTDLIKSIYKAMLSLKN